MSVSSASSLSLSERLRKTALQIAFQSQIRGENAQDCASDFVLRMLQKFDPAELLSSDEQYCTAWWRQCAVNHAINYRRGLMRLQSHLVPWDECISIDTSDSTLGEAGSHSSPEGAFLQSELHFHLFQAIACLDITHRNYFLRHHLQGESVLSIAEASQKTPNAIRKTLARAKKQLRHLLAEQGLTEAELRNYLDETR